MAHHFAIGIDLGGTTVKTALVDTNGNIFSQVKLPTLADQNPEAVIGQIKKSIDEILLISKGKSISGVGIAVPGLVENPGGILKNPANFKGWDIIALGDELEKMFGMKTVVDNDANVAALAEAKFGSGKDHPDFLFVIWGTGVGGGIILDGNIYRGPHGGAGEIGHISIDHKGLKCNCGTIGCVEAYIGQKYLSNRTIEKLQVNSDSKIVELVGGDLSKIEPIFISKAAEAGDQLAKEILVEAGTLLGVMLGGVMNTLDFRVTIIGGGVSAVGDFVYDAVRASTVAHVQKPLKSGIKILRAQLGNDAGMLGAAGMVL
ncbi:MAG: ROK family protein [Bacteroidota bacterium]|nr:ROK family protein [Bacteroidota bacterium]